MSKNTRPAKRGQITVDFRPLFDPAAYIADIPRKCDSEDAIEFLRATVGEFGNLTAIHPKTEAIKGFGFDRASFSKVRWFIEAHAQWNLYWTPNLTRRLLNKKPRKTDIAAMGWVHLDLDDPSREALARLRQANPRPTLIIFSGGGFQAFWRLKEPVRVNGNVAELEAINKHAIKVFGADKGTWNLDRVMRLPHTVNHPTPVKLERGRKPAAAYIVEWQPSRQYTLQELAALTAPGEPMPRDSAARVPNSAVSRAVHGTVKKVDRSRVLFRKVANDIRADLTYEQIHAKHADDPHVRSQPDRVRAINRAIDHARAQITPWGEPQPLVDVLPPVEAFDPELLPKTVRAWVVDNAERMQAPIEFVAIAVMVMLATLLGRKIAVRPRRLDNWYEIPTFWALLIGSPASMKSPATEEALNALRAIEDELLVKYEEEHQEWERAKVVSKVRHEGAKRRATSLVSKGKEFDEAQLALEEVREPLRQRLISNDTNVASLCELLIASPNGLLVHRDEMAGLIAEMDAPGHEGDRAFYLQGKSGKEPYTQDRISAGSRHVPHVCLSMLGTIQPMRATPLVRESVATGGGDGFLPRFDLTVWPDPPGQYKRIDRAPDDKARKEALAVYAHLHALDEHAAQATRGIDGGAPYLRLKSGAAADVHAEWDVALVNRMRAGEDAALSAHLLKYRKTVPGFALLIHLAEYGKGDVPLGAVQRALKWAKFLESHARRLYGSLGQANTEAARSLVRHIRKGDLTSPFRVRDLHRKGWASLADQESAQAAVDVLLGAGNYIREQSVGPGPEGGRTTLEYWINPALLKGKDGR